MRINDAGNVGIGTGTPDGKLCLNTATQTKLTLALSGSTKYRIQCVSGANYIDCLDQTFFIRGGSNGTVPNLTVLNDGNVGIGTVSPLYTLDVSKDTGPDPQVSIRSGQADKDGILGFPLAGDCKASIITNKHLSFHTNTTTNSTNERVRITDQGNIGIGTSTPQSLLHLKGYPYITLENTDAGNDLKNWMLSGGTDGKFRLRSGTDAYSYTNVIIVDHTGNCGIGTASPSAKLDVDGTIRNNKVVTSATGDYTRVNAAIISRGKGGKAILIGVDDSQKPYVQAGNADGDTGIETLAINPNGGDVGIGTSSPTQKLDVTTTVTAPNQAIWSAANLVLKDDSAFAESTGGAMLFQGKFNSSGQYSTYGYIRGGKANSTDGAFQGNLTIASRSGSIIFANGNDGLTDGSNELIRINSSGNVGIGTDDPKSKVDLASTGNVTVRYQITTGTADNKTLIQNYTGGSFYWQAINDSGAGGGNLVRMIRTGTSIDSFECVRNGNTWFKVDNVASKVGIGTTDPNGLIHFEKNGIVESWYSSTETGGATWRVGTAGTASGLNGAYRIYDQTNSATRFVIDSSGNVGIGTASPSVKLEISDASSARIRLNRPDGTNTYSDISATTGALILDSRNNASNGQILFRGLGGNTISEYARFDTSGRLLVRV